ncbi:nose resistant to fluoxetine protein 6-like isoform X2 [Musca autumnalis]|uniref:nose resistant to fluoxetine protein 6-like isoform X2 n=1 Tax=Musca autumnalis TaxID=221902 RepID=UPI003CF0AD30
MLGVKNIVLCIILMGSTNTIVNGYTEDFSYKQMPALYDTADYNSCLQQISASYCMTYVEIQEDNNSELWHNIWNFTNSYRYHYRHDQLYRGICTTQCKNVSPPVDQNKSANYLWNENVRMAQKLHKISRDQQTLAKNEDKLHQCIAEEFRGKYNLSVKTFVTYCDNPQEPIAKGSSYYISIFVLMCIVILNLFSTIFDAYLKSTQNEPKRSPCFYDKQHGNSAHKYLCSFSIYRNYRRLIAPNASAMGKDLQFVDGFRTLLSIVIVIEHLIYTQFMPVENPDYFEQQYSSTLMLTLTHMLVSIELFFMLSGLMLYLKFTKGEYVTPQSSLRQCFRVYVRLLISRYLRYIPSLLLLILFSSNILLYLQTAPFWRHIMEPNVILCRSEWWSNLFMTANLGINNCCWVHTWYIAADFQLYAIFLALLILCAKYPQHKNSIYAVIGSVGALLPSIISYILKLQSIGTCNIENYRHIYLKDVKTGEYVYLSPYCNLSGFFIGLICGEIYMKYLRNDRCKQIVGNRIKFLIPLGWLIILAIWYLGSKLLFVEASIWTALYAIPHRPISLAIVASIVIIYKMCHGGGFLTWPIFRPLARISYQVYLWHFPILFSILGSSHKPIRVSQIFLIKLLLKTYLLGAIASFFIAIMLEYPIAEFLSVFELKIKTG